MSPSRQFGNIHYRNKSEYRNKINRFSSDGANNLKVVMDFDYTMSKEYSGAYKKLFTSFARFTQCASIPDVVKQEMYKLYMEYSQYEKESRLPESYRYEKLDEWCRKTSELFRNCAFDWKDIEVVVEGAKDLLRKQTKELLQLTSRNKMPLFIVSGGQGDCILSILKDAEIILNDYIHIVSNFLDSKDDLLNGFKEPMVHPLNKQDCLNDNAFYRATSNRKNLIVVGDSLHDAKVKGKNASDENTLTVGFLNKHDENVLQRYLEVFDVVIVEDDSMVFLTELINDIIQH